MSAWKPDLSRILSADDVQDVRADLHRRRRSKGTRLAAAIFELAVGAGLRASEIAALEIRNVRTEVSKPTIQVKNGKGGKDRVVPIIDAAALAGLRVWRAERLADGASAKNLFVCALSKGSEGKRLHRNVVNRKFLNACKSLGADRLERLSVHDGRHTFASHAVEAKGIPWTRDALGHSNIATTSVYSHALDQHSPASLYGGDDPEPAAPKGLEEMLDQLSPGQLRQMLKKALSGQPLA